MTGMKTIDDMSSSNMNVLYSKPISKHVDVCNTPTLVKNKKNSDLSVDMNKYSPNSK